MSRLALFGGVPIRTKPFPLWPVFDEAEELALLEVLRSGKWWRYAYAEGDGMREPDTGPRSKVAEFQEAFADFQGARYGVACANGSAALEVALKSLGAGPGDEIIVPAYTFVATAFAVLMVNAIPIFADIEQDTYNIDPQSIERAITPNTRGIIPVHFAGQAADMEKILSIARERNIWVLEDAAHGHAGNWKDKGLGSIGEAGTFSFQASKNMTAGEGGMITTNNPDLAALCESYIWAGRKQGRPWYEHHRLGWNYRMTEFQGAILRQQLNRVETQNERRRRNAAYLNRHLNDFPGIHAVATRDFATKHSFHIYMFRFREEESGISRKDLIAGLTSEGIPCSTGYMHPLYKNPAFLNQDFFQRGCPVNCGHYAKPLDYSKCDCPASEAACREAVWLEHRLLLGEEQDMKDIVRAIEKIYENRCEFNTLEKEGR